MTFTEWLASTFGTTVVLAALVGAFWKVILNHITAGVAHEFAKDLEAYKNQLNRETELAIKDVEAKASERAIKLGKIFSEQADTVIKIYQMLVPLHDAIRTSVLFRDRNALPNDEETQQINKMTRDFYNYFSLNKIYLPPDAASKIEVFVRKLSTEKMLFDLIMQEYPTGHHEKSKKRLEAYDTFTKEVPTLLKGLEDDLQMILGFHAPAKAK